MKNHCESRHIANATCTSQLVKTVLEMVTGLFEVIKLTLLFLASFITNGRPQLESGAVCQCTISGANHDAQARFLQDLTVVVVGVAHGPTTQVALRVFVFGTIYVPNITICPLLKRVVLLRVL